MLAMWSAYGCTCQNSESHEPQSGFQPRNRKQLAFLGRNAQGLTAAAASAKRKKIKEEARYAWQAIGHWAMGQLGHIETYFLRKLS
jgi:hypothetical protein